MSTNDKIADLRALTEALEEVAAAESAAAEAKAAYRANPTPENRAAHRAASQALNDAREAVRGTDVPRAVVPGDVSITPNTVG